ncbi:MAG: N-acetyltransferase GCN5 [Bacillota bacterium]|nr:MAG: N-acetyltransferase GCN5 [Bacillota bacterium]MBS3950506.1 GNAT family N-acetyltransferase [Peptococcaceae bacterium]
MIRSFKKDDSDILVALIQQDKPMQTDEIIKRLSKNKAWVYDDGVIKGCAAATALREGPYGKRVDVWAYTAPEFRRQGVGQALWSEVAAYIEQCSPDITVAGYRSDKGNAGTFFSKRGFSYWFSTHSMSYDGGYFPESDLTPIPYAEAYFDEVITLINEGFYGLREANGMIPIECFPPGYDRAKVLEEFAEDRDNIFLFVQGKVLVGYTRLGNDYIDDIVVSRKHQRQGFGQKIAQFSVNTLRERGVNRVFLGVVDTNTGARDLYERLGFELVETHTFARKVGAK